MTDYGSMIPNLSRIVKRHFRDSSRGRLPYAGADSRSGTCMVLDGMRGRGIALASPGPRVYNVWKRTCKAPPFCPACPVPSAAAGRHIGKPVIACERLRREGASARWPASKGQGRARFSLCPAVLIRDLPSLRRAFAYRRAGGRPVVKNRPIERGKLPPRLRRGGFSQQI